MTATGAIESGGRHRSPFALSLSKGASERRSWFDRSTSSRLTTNGTPPPLSIAPDCHHKRNVALYDGDYVEDEQLIRELILKTSFAPRRTRRHGGKTRACAMHLHHPVGDMCSPWLTAIF
jgi:hypothetical protein